MSAIVWRRYGHWAAHAHVDGAQVCSIQHGSYLGFKGPSTVPPAVVVEFAECGLPYGKVCSRCLKIVGQGRPR